MDHGALFAAPGEDTWSKLPACITIDACRVDEEVSFDVFREAELVTCHRNRQHAVPDLPFPNQIE